MCPKVTLLGRGKARVRTRAAGLRGGGGLSGPAASLQPHRGGLRCSACRYPSAASRGRESPARGGTARPRRRLLPAPRGAGARSRRLKGRGG